MQDSRWQLDLLPCLRMPKSDEVLEQYLATHVCCHGAPTRSCERLSTLLEQSSNGRYNFCGGDGAAECFGLLRKIDSTTHDANFRLCPWPSGGPHTSHFTAVTVAVTR